MSSVIKNSLPSPLEMEKQFPLSPEAMRTVQASRITATKILRGEDPRLALLVGPCSIHDPLEAIEYGIKLKALQEQSQEKLFLIMRVFLEKPRTRLGWKGMLYDPYLDGSSDLQEGLCQARKLLLELNELGVPCATEFLDPLVAIYTADFISWGLIGARTSASQPHRQLASGLPFPVGFKNDIHGQLDPAISGIVTARMPHAHFSIDRNGRIASLQTTGNSLTHLVLRGSDVKPNCDSESIKTALRLLREHHLEERLVIDCAHGNSGKNLRQQRNVFFSALEQNHPSVRALMIESQLIEGKQPLDEEPDQLLYGVSVTDPCFGWEETEELILLASGKLAFPSISMSSVQK
jgi:3-deoxy-7-phosphoheptulonate synthase